jgi:predicted ester cyclase
MTRFLLLPLTVLLALATALGLLAVGATLSQAPVTVASLPAAAADATDQFYVAADLALHTGDTTALLAAVAPGYVDHATPPASPDGVPGYARFLVNLRADCPDCRLTTRDLAVSHDQAAVRVRIWGHRQVIVAGVEVEGFPLTWTALEVVRIVGGQVAEPWSQGDPPARTQSPATPVPEAGTAGSAELQVARFVLPPETDLPPFRTAGPTVLVLEQGMVSLTVDGAWRFGNANAPEAELIHIEMTVVTGQQQSLTSGLSHRIRNVGPEPAALVILATNPIEVLPRT